MESNDNNNDNDNDNLISLKFNLDKCISAINDKNDFSSENNDVKKILKDLKEINTVNKVDDYVLNLAYLIKQIDCFLEKNCDHDWFHDTVEYGLDNSKDIKYCKKCFIGY